MEPVTIDTLIMSSYCLHNMLITDKNIYLDNNNDNNMPAQNMLLLRRAGGAEVVSAVNIRNEMKDYICSSHSKSVYINYFISHVSAW